ncbi:MAG: T9SS type A sorting domain-containing protein, partial [Muribaculaceae bacterium]|nr:T9SS type A sorting domain-containing protein [Muribaculaceae bacterium]
YRADSEWGKFLNIVEGEATAAELTLTTTADDFSGVKVTVDGKDVDLSGTTVTLNAEVGSVVMISPADFAVINAVTADGATAVQVDGTNFRVVVTEEKASVGIDWAVGMVKVATVPSFSNGVITGRLLLSYDGVSAETLSLPLGATLTFVAEPAEGYEFDHVTRIADGADDSFNAGDSYTAVRADMGEEVLFKAVFTKTDSGISSIIADIDADATVTVMTPAGVRVLSAKAATLDMSSLPAGMYIVTGGGKTVKIVR